MTPQSMAGSLFGVGIASSLIGGVGSYEAGQQQKSAYDYNADVTLLNMRSEMAANQQRTSTLIGRQTGAYAASGVDIASGSPLLIMAATAARGAVRGEQIRESDTEEAALQRYYGRIAAFQGTMGGIGSFLSGISKSAAGYAAGQTPGPSVNTGDEGGGVDG